MNQPKIVLIHGAWHGPWCWQKLAVLLRQANIEVFTPCLPGHNSSASIATVKVTWQVYLEFLKAELNKFEHPVTLLGHSLAGGLITELAAVMPEKIQQLIYLAAFIPQQGQTIQDCALQDTHNSMQEVFYFSKDKTIINLDKSIVGEIFYHDCSEKDVNVAVSKLVPQAFKTLITPIKADASQITVPCYYVECLQDKVKSIQSQRTAYANLAQCEVSAINTGHSPFFAQPKQLADILSGIIN